MMARSKSRLPAVALATLVAGACTEPGTADAAAGADNQAPGISDTQFDQMLRDALMRNPEVIIDAIEAYRAQMEADAERASRDVLAGLIPELIAAEAGHAIGASAEDAEIVVVEFFDYHCGFCKRALDDVITLTDENPGVRVVFQELPILRDESREASIAALAAGSLGGPEAYSAVHRELMEAEGTLDQNTIDAAIRRAGLNPRNVARTIDQQGDDVEAVLDRSIEIARQVGVSGTPYFVMLNTKTKELEILSGYLPERFADKLAAVSD